MPNYASHVKKKSKGQMTKDRKDQVKNDAGGFVYKVDKFTMLDRFCILGTEGGDYYVGEREMTKASAKTVLKLLNKSVKSGIQVIDRVVEISDSGRAAKNDHAIFVLALALVSDHIPVRNYAIKAVPKICRIAPHIFLLVDFCNEMRGWGRGLRRTVAEWYNGQAGGKLAYQVCKYQSRSFSGGQKWSHIDLLRLAHVKPSSEVHSIIFQYLSKGWDKTSDVISSYMESNDNDDLKYIVGHEKAKSANSEDEMVKLIKDYRLSRESIPTEYLKYSKVWGAMLDNKMPLTAMIRNLATMTRNGVITPLGRVTKKVTNQLTNTEVLEKARIHPVNILSGMKTYASGHGVRSSNSWTPSQPVVDALDEAFYASFKTVEPTGKRILVAIDCSGSMGCPVNGLPHISAREAAAAMAMAIAKVEKDYYIVGFTSSSSFNCPWGRTNTSTKEGINSGMKDLKISPRMRMDSTIKALSIVDWGGTDCALPMLFAQANALEVDAFVIITDNDTYDNGNIKSDEALRRYRDSSGINDAKLIVLGTSASRFTIGDPDDSNTMNLAGFDSAAPQIIADFIAGRI